MIDSCGTVHCTLILRSRSRRKNRPAPRLPLACDFCKRQVAGRAHFCSRGGRQLLLFAICIEKIHTHITKSSEFSFSSFNEPFFAILQTDFKKKIRTNNVLCQEICIKINTEMDQNRADLIYALKTCRGRTPERPFYQP